MSLAAPPTLPVAEEAAAVPRWYTHRHNRPAYYRLVMALAPRLPRPLRVRAARGLGRLLASRFPSEQAAVRRNLERVHPGRDRAWRAATVTQVFENFAICFADLLSVNGRSEAQLRRVVAGVDDQAPTREVLGENRGCVCLTAHLGNWELAGRALATLGRRVHVLMAPELDPRLGALLGRRTAGAVRVVRRDGPLVAIELLAALRRGEVVALQLDRGTGARADCRLPFFGAPAPFPLGPFLLAAAGGAPIVPAFCVLDQHRTYRLIVEPPIEVKRGEETAGLERAVRVLERHVAAHADQWFNFFDVWGGAR